MEFENLKSQNNNEINDVFIIKPNFFEDDRGFFFESWNQKKFDAIVGEEITFCQDNHSRSAYGVLRGLHYQLDPHPQGKLVRCTSGIIYDVAVDIRKDSPTFGKWGGIKLSSANKLQLWIPRGFAHGFLTISDFAEVQYKTNGYWNRDCERSLRWNDESLEINWLDHLNIKEPFLSQKDSVAQTFLEAQRKGDIF